jgi:hypothetical protein
MLDLCSPNKLSLMAKCICQVYAAKTIPSLSIDAANLEKILRFRTGGKSKRRHSESENVISWAFCESLYKIFHVLFHFHITII